MIDLELLVSRSQFFKALYREKLITDEIKYNSIIYNSPIVDI